MLTAILSCLPHQTQSAFWGCPPPPLSPPTGLQEMHTLTFRAGSCEGCGMVRVYALLHIYRNPLRLICREVARGCALVCWLPSLRVRFSLFSPLVGCATTVQCAGRSISVVGGGGGDTSRCRYCTSPLCLTLPYSSPPPPSHRSWASRECVGGPVQRRVRPKLPARGSGSSEAGRGVLCGVLRQRQCGRERCDVIGGWRKVHG
jgi:hypothetical protein